MKRETKGWSKERRAAQARNCRRTKPWTRATGPQTQGGKERVRHNALKHGLRSADIRALNYILAWQRAYVRAVLGRTVTTETIPWTDDHNATEDTTNKDKQGTTETTP